MQDEIEKRLLVLIKRIVKRDLKPEDKIFTSGLISSLIFKQIVFSIEKEFCIKFESVDMQIKNFQSIKAITELLYSKLT